MTQCPLKNLSLVHHFAALTEPRGRRTKQHSSNDIIVIAIRGFVCGGKSWEPAAVCGRPHADWFRTFLELPKGIPSKDTFRRVFARIKPYAFKRCFRSWGQTLAETLRIEVLELPVPCPERVGQRWLLRRSAGCRRKEQQMCDARLSKRAWKPPFAT